MTNKKKWIAGAAVATILAGGFGGVAVANGGGGNDDGERETPITGDAYDKATAKALEVTGGGKVTATEVDDEEGYYQVEVTNADGSQTDVNLDKAFNVVKTKTENESGDEGADDDGDGAHEGPDTDGDTAGNNDSD